MMKKWMMLAVGGMLSAALPLAAETESVDGIVWNYVISDGNAIIYNNGLAVIPTSTTGAITIPATLGGKPVSSIGRRAFYYCRKLTSVTIPDSVKSIGDGAFFYCYGLTSVTIGNGVTSVGDGAFEWCDALKSFFVGSGNANFSSRNGLLLSKDGKTLISGVNGDVTIPDSVMSISGGAFWGCRGLTTVMIPDSVTYVGPQAFFGCDSLKSFFVGSGNANFSSRNRLLLSKDGKTLISGVNGDVIIPDSVTSIGLCAFDNLNGLTSVTFPNSVTTIGVQAFGNCDGLTSVTIPDSVTTIGDHAFGECDGLTSVTIPDSVKSIGTQAFYFCQRLTSVTIPDSVMSIGAWVFDGCSEMLFDTNSIPGVKLVDGWAVGYTDSLSGDLNLTGIRGIGADAFRECRGLTNVMISGSVTSIGAAAFWYCNGLTSVTIPDSVTSIGVSAFSDCNGLTRVTIPNGVTNIGNYAFWNCEMMSSVIFTGNAPTVGYSAFSNVKSGCTAYVRENSTGWGVEIPGTWNGLQIKYIGPVEEWAFGVPLANTAFSFDQTMVNSGTSTVELISGGYEYEDAALGKAIKLTGFDGPWSPQNLDFSENWTILATARISSVEDAVLFGIGSSEAGQAGFALASGGTNMVTLSYWSPQERHVDLLTVPVADMEKRFHSYALRARGLAVELFVDGVLKGSTSFPSKPSGRTAFQFFSILQGSGETGLGVHVGSSIDDWRFYNEALQNQAIISYAVLGANGQGEGSVTAIGDVPFVQVASGVTLTILEPELSAAALAAKITPKPHEAGQSASLFKVKAEAVVGGVSLAVVLDEDVVDPDETAAEIVDAETVTVFGAAADGATVSVPLASAKQGLYYGIVAAGNLDGLNEAAANTPLVRAGEDGVTIPVVKPAGGAAFFKVIVSDRAR